MLQSSIAFSMISLAFLCFSLQTEWGIFLCILVSKASRFSYTYFQTLNYALSACVQYHLLLLRNMFLYLRIVICKGNTYSCAYCRPRCRFRLRRESCILVPTNVVDGTSRSRCYMHRGLTTLGVGGMGPFFSIANFGISITMISIIF